MKTTHAQQSGEKTTPQTPTASRGPRIVLAEDDDEMRTLLVRALRKTGYEVVECPDGVALLDHLSHFLLPARPEHVDLVISDIRMPGLTGLEVLEGLHLCNTLPPVILITAFGDQETHMLGERFGAVAMFDKPFDIEDLLDKVREIIPAPAGFHEPAHKRSNP